MEFGWLLGIVGMAVLFAVVGAIPLSHRSCGECAGDCNSCVFDADGALSEASVRPSTEAGS
jgi:hypothetical protein